MATQTTKEAVLSSPGPSLPGCIELTLFEALVIPGGQENAVESLRREESNKGNILHSFLITNGRTQRVLNVPSPQTRPHFFFGLS